jgi:hypothetical protein
VVHNRAPHRFRGLLASQRGQETETVLAGVRRKSLTDQRGERSHHVRQAAELIARRARSDPIRPTRNEWHAVSRLPDVGLLAAIVHVRAMSELPDVRRRPMRAVVAGEDHERVAGELEAVQRLDHPPDGVVHLDDEIAVITGAALAAKSAGWLPRFVRCREREIEEEGVARRGPRLAF